MRTTLQWLNKIHEADKTEFSSIHSLCFSPNGQQLVVGAGEKVMIYDPTDGTLIQVHQAHKGIVYTVAYSADGKKFASGGADKNVIIWTSKLEGVLKYSHNDAVQCLAYNPVTYQLASCAVTDFAYWSAEVKAVQKYKVNGRLTNCCWTPNGQYLAIGLASGGVTIRDKTGDEIQKISRDSAVWALTFSGSTLIVTDWNETLSFYNLQGQSVLKERNIGISAMSICLLGELLLVGGLGGWSILTSEGIPILSTQQNWVWCISAAPSNNSIALACQDGTLWCHQVIFSTVHGLYRDRYAYRENMTDVIIQHLTTGNKVRIKCHDKVQKVAIYKHRLAVQLPERVVVYEQGDADGMLYRVKEKLQQVTECSLLVATSDSLLLCQDTKLLMIGKKVPRSWSVPSPIRYVKVALLRYHEVLLLGLLNGQIWCVDPDSDKSRLLLETSAAVRCFDVATTRHCVAVVDDLSVCRVFSLDNAEMMFAEENVTSVSWNYCNENLLCMSGNGVLAIKAGNFAPSTQPLTGSVVGFQGSRIFCLQSNAMQTINVPLSHAVHQYIQHHMFNQAYAVACLGVTSADWERLGFAALEELSFEVARKAFQRIENYLYLALIDTLEEKLESGEKRELVLGEILAHRGRLSEAARTFKSANREDKAMHMYTDLRMFNKAQEWIGEAEGGASGRALARRRAEWARHVQEPRAAAQMYLAAGDLRRAVDIMAANQYTDMLVETARTLDKGETESLRLVGEALVQAGSGAAAALVFQRLADHKRVAELAVAAGEWHRAFQLAREHDDCRRDVYVAYANQMARDNNFLNAQKAYHMAGETATAMRVLLILVKNALWEERFSDAGYLHHLLAVQCAEIMQTKAESEMERWVERYRENERLSALYYAYEPVHRAVHEPFSLSQPDALFNTARFLLATLSTSAPHPPALSLFCVYLCLAKQARALKANSIAKQMLDKIMALQVPAKFQESVELLTLKTRGAPMGQGSEEDTAVLCWRCRRPSSALLSPDCPRCRHRLVYSYVSFEALPLVKFEPESDITTDEALSLIDRMPLSEKKQTDSSSTSDGAQIMRIDTPEEAPDPFLDKFEDGENGSAVLCNRDDLLNLNPASVVVVKQPNPLPTLFYRNMLPELIVMACPKCYKVFYMEDYELHVVTKGCCPYCRHSKREDADSDFIASDSSPINGLYSSSPPNSPSLNWN